MIEQLEQLEAMFSKNNYYGESFEGDFYQVLQGKSRVLISAPHSVNHTRENKIKLADMYTGSLARLLHYSTGCNCIFSTGTSFEDPNYTLGGKYKNALKNLVHDNNVKFVVDLHGAAIDREFDIDLGTIYGQTMDKEHIKKIKEIFNVNDILEVKENFNFSANHLGTITSYTHNQISIQSIQVEINRKFRSLSESQNILKLFNSLVQIVHYLESCEQNDKL